MRVSDDDGHAFAVRVELKDGKFLKLRLGALAPNFIVSYFDDFVFFA